MTLNILKVYFRKRWLFLVLAFSIHVQYKNYVINENVLLEVNGNISGHIQLQILHHLPYSLEGPKPHDTYSSLSCVSSDCTKKNAFPYHSVFCLPYPCSHLCPSLLQGSSEESYLLFSPLREIYLRVVSMVGKDLTLKLSIQSLRTSFQYSPRSFPQIGNKPEIKLSACLVLTLDFRSDLISINSYCGLVQIYHFTPAGHRYKYYLNPSNNAFCLEIILKQQQQDFEIF